MQRQVCYFLMWAKEVLHVVIQRDVVIGTSQNVPDEERFLIRECLALLLPPGNVSSATLLVAVLKSASRLFLSAQSQNRRGRVASEMRELIIDVVPLRLLFLRERVGAYRCWDKGWERS
jgi:hypothetical protein